MSHTESNVSAGNMMSPTGKSPRRRRKALPDNCDASVVLPSGGTVSPGQLEGCQPLGKLPGDGAAPRRVGDLSRNAAPNQSPGQLENATLLSVPGSDAASREIESQSISAASQKSSGQVIDDIDKSLPDQEGAVTEAADPDSITAPSPISAGHLETFSIDVMPAADAAMRQVDLSLGCAASESISPPDRPSDYPISKLPGGSGAAFVELKPESWVAAPSQLPGQVSDGITVPKLPGGAAAIVELDTEASNVAAPDIPGRYYHDGLTSLPGDAAAKVGVETQRRIAAAFQIPAELLSSGPINVDHGIARMPDGGASDAGMQTNRCDEAPQDPVTAARCAVLVELQSQRVAALRQIIRIGNGCTALIGRYLGFRVDLAEDERAKINKRAAEIVKLFRSAEPAPDDDTAKIMASVSGFVSASIVALDAFEGHKKAIEKAMTTEAQQLPVWAWAKDIRGFGAVGLAIIVGESGDLSRYATPYRLWKRLGLAVIDGRAQGKPGAGATAEEWIRHGYNPRRRSAIWTLGDSLIKGNRDGKYRTLYLARKEYEAARDAEKIRVMADYGEVITNALISQPKPMSKMHIHLRAQRVMEKELIADLWRAWTKKPEEKTADC